MPRKISEIQAEIERLEEYLKRAKPHEKQMMDSKRNALFKELEQAGGTRAGGGLGSIYGKNDFREVLKDILGEKNDGKPFDLAAWMEKMRKTGKK
jgi:hypothetical protein